MRGRNEHDFVRKDANAIKGEVAEGEEAVSMRRVKLVLVVLAMMMVMVASAAPAMARHNNDGWWDDCDWVFYPWWGWFVVCQVDDDWWDYNNWHDNNRHHNDRDHNDRYWDDWWW